MLLTPLMADIVIVETYSGTRPHEPLKNVPSLSPSASSSPSTGKGGRLVPSSPQDLHTPLNSTSSLTSNSTLNSTTSTYTANHHHQVTPATNLPTEQVSKTLDFAHLSKAKENSKLSNDSNTSSGVLSKPTDATPGGNSESTSNGVSTPRQKHCNTSSSNSSGSFSFLSNLRMKSSLSVVENPTETAPADCNRGNTASEGLTPTVIATPVKDRSLSLSKGGANPFRGSEGNLTTLEIERKTPSPPRRNINAVRGSKLNSELKYRPTLAEVAAAAKIPRLRRGCGDPSCPLRRPQSRLYRSVSLPAPSGVWGVVRPNTCSGRSSSWSTLLRHYYPEGGWGWLVLGMATGTAVLNHGLQTSYGALLMPLARKFQIQVPVAGGLGALSTALALLLSPVTISVCRRKSTRLTAVLGGLVTALGCLFTSFASQYHQLFFSYGTVIGIGVGLTRDSSTLMVGQYFKRRREAVEVLVVGGSGLGISAMSAFIRGAINSFGWRLGLQAVTCAVFLTFLMGTFYRSASLYHPQRRAILHLKNQKRKVKEKCRQEDRTPFFDVTTLRSRTIQILLVSTGLSSFGITTPILYLAQQAEEAGLEEGSVLLLQAYLGLGWFAGCATFGFLTVHRSTECRIGLQYLCQASMFLCGVTCLAFTAVEGYPGYVLFSWLYGMFCGGFHYALKMFTYEKVRARNFARTWGFVQCSQALPTALGLPITGYINIEYGNKAGYYFSSTFIIFGSMTIFLIDVHRRRAARHKHRHKSGRQHTCVRRNCPASRSRRDSLADINPEPPGHTPSLASLLHNTRNNAGMAETLDGRTKPELTCISEEGIADMDLPDHLLEELDYLGDCITSCDKVENYLMRSEYENNLIIRPGGAQQSNSGVPIAERRFSRLKRTFSVRTQNTLIPHPMEVPSRETDEGSQAEDPQVMGQVVTSNQTGGPQNRNHVLPGDPPASLPPDVNTFNGRYTPQRHITMIEEASV